MLSADLTVVRGTARLSQSELVMAAGLVLVQSFFQGYQLEMHALLAPALLLRTIVNLMVSTQEFQPGESGA